MSKLKELRAARDVASADTHKAYKAYQAAVRANDSVFKAYYAELDKSNRLRAKKVAAALDAELKENKG